MAVLADLGVGDIHFDDRVGRCGGGDGGMCEQGIGDDLGVQAGLFENLALGRLGGVFVGVDVPAEVEPLAELVVVDQQHLLVIVEHDRRSGEVADADHGVGPSRAMVARCAAIHSTVASGTLGVNWELEGGRGGGPRRWRGHDSNPTRVSHYLT